ncbi:MAG: hypothetical protein RBR15_04765 [Sphaerochaeta sp.]|nr:hypothetical protein [Sphaerochaeta sp.]
MKKRTYFLLATMIIVTLLVVISCDPDTAKTYPPWFNDYSGGVLVDLKAVQDDFACFGNTIGSNVVIYGTLDEPPISDLNYYEDDDGKHFMVTFGTRDGELLVDSTDIQPFRDAVLARGFVYNSETLTYEKGNISIFIYVMNNEGDPHFEFAVDQTY